MSLIDKLSADKDERISFKQAINGVCSVIPIVSWFNFVLKNEEKIKNYSLKLLGHSLYLGAGMIFLYFGFDRIWNPMKYPGIQNIIHNQIQESIETKNYLKTNHSKNYNVCYLYGDDFWKKQTSISKN